MLSAYRVKGARTMHRKCGPCRAWLKLAPGIITQADYKVLRASAPGSEGQDQSQCFVSAVEVHHAGSQAVDFKEGGCIALECKDGYYRWDLHTKEQFQGLQECWTGGVYLDSSGHAVVVLSDAADRPHGPPYADGNDRSRLGIERVMHEGDALQIVQQAGLSEGTTTVPMRLMLNKLVLGTADVTLEVGPDKMVKLAYGELLHVMTGLHLPVYDCGYYWDAADKTLVKLINRVAAPPYPRKMDLHILEPLESMRALQEKQGGTFTTAADGTAPPTVKVLAHDGDTTEEMMDQDDGGSISAHTRNNDAGHANREGQAQPGVMTNHPGDTIADANCNDSNNAASKFGYGTRSLKVYGLNPEGTHRVNALWCDALAYGRLSPSTPRFFICDEFHEPLQGCERVTAGRLLELVGFDIADQAMECVCLAEDFVYLAVLYRTGTCITVLLKQRSRSRCAKPRLDSRENETEGEHDFDDVTRPLGPSQPSCTAEQAHNKAISDLGKDLARYGLPFVAEDWVIKTNLRKDMRWAHTHIYKDKLYKSRLKALQQVCDERGLCITVTQVVRGRTIPLPPKESKRLKPSKGSSDAGDDASAKKKSRKQSDPQSSMGINDYVEAALAAPRVSDRPTRRAAIAGVAAAAAAVRMSDAVKEDPDEQYTWQGWHAAFSRKQPMTARASATQPMQVENPYGNHAMYQDQPAAEDEEDDYQYGNEYDDVLPPNCPAAGANGHAVCATGRTAAGSLSGVPGSAAQAHTLASHTAVQGIRVCGQPPTNGQAAHRAVRQASPVAATSAGPPTSPRPLQPPPAGLTSVPAAPVHEPVGWETLQRMLPEIKDVQETADGNVVLTYDMRQKAYTAVCSVLRSLGKAEAAEALFLKWRRHYSASPAGSKEFLDAYVMLQGAAQFSEAAMLDVLKEDFKLPA